MSKEFYYCLICKKEKEKDERKGLMPSIASWIACDSKEEVIEHIKKCHPKEYKSATKSRKTNK